MSNYDLGTLLSALFTALLGPTLGPIIGPALGLYAAIIFAAVMGAAVALLRREPGALPGPVFFVSLMVGVALVVTVPATTLLLNQWWGEKPPVTILVLAPVVSFGIAFVGHDWRRAFPWVLSLGKRFVERRVGVDPQPPQPGDRP